MIGATDGAPEGKTALSRVCVSSADRVRKVDEAGAPLSHEIPCLIFKYEASCWDTGPGGSTMPLGDGEDTYFPKVLREPKSVGDMCDKKNCCGTLSIAQYHSNMLGCSGCDRIWPIKGQPLPTFKYGPARPE
eukprot:g29407.t1